jgi:hypothetical protein
VRGDGARKEGGGDTAIQTKKEAVFVSAATSFRSHHRREHSLFIACPAVVNFHTPLLKNEIEFTAVPAMMITHPIKTFWRW